MSTTLEIATQMPVRLSALLLSLLLAAPVSSPTAVAQGNCEAMPRGSARTDCFIARARIASEKAALANDKARVEGEVARLLAATGISAQRELCRGKVAGPRVLYVLSDPQPLGNAVPSKLHDPVVCPPMHRANLSTTDPFSYALSNNLLRAELTRGKTKGGSSLGGR